MFPTVLDLLPVSPADSGSGKPCQQLLPDMNVCLPPQGKSLAPAVLGTPVSDPSAPSARYPQGDAPASKKAVQQLVSTIMPSLGNDLVAVTQSWRCAFKSKLAKLTPQQVNGTKMPEKRGGFSPWFECARKDSTKPAKRSQQVCVMGYSLRYAVARYTIWLHWDRVKNVPQLTAPPFAEELYDHRGETLQNFTHLELENVIHRPEFADVARKFKAKALHFLEHDVQFRGPYEK